jgi:K+-sensing histidine kinase KdpD
LLACDLNDISDTIPVDSLKKILELFNAPLTLLNVDHNNRNFSAQTPEEIHHLHYLLDKYKPQYAFIDHEDTATGILDYAEKNEVSLIVTIKKNYDFFQKLFHKSTSKKLIYRSAIPLLILHESEQIVS